jgi:hypothetical protein
MFSSKELIFHVVFQISPKKCASHFYSLVRPAGFEHAHGGLTDPLRAK